jgi:hypothetical protein
MDGPGLESLHRKNFFWLWDPPNFRFNVNLGLLLEINYTYLEVDQSLSFSAEVKKE